MNDKNSYVLKSISIDTIMLAPRSRIDNMDNTATTILLINDIKCRNTILGLRIRLLPRY